MSDDDDDDLDAFFDEVEEVAEEAKKEEAHQVDTNEPAADADAATDAATDATTDATETTQEDRDRPSKKARLDPAPVHVAEVPSSRGRGTVVVSKKAATATISAPPIRNITAAAATTTKARDEIYQITVPERSLNPSIPPPPPLPPLPGPNTALPNYHPSYTNTNTNNDNANANVNAKPAVRMAAGKQWVDNTLADFPENDYRLFVGNLDKIITEAKLAEAFQLKYPSFAMSKIIYDKMGVSKGYGFVSVMDPKDCAKAIREMDQSWLGSRPIKVKRSDWKERDLREVRKDKKKKGRR